MKVWHLRACEEYWMQEDHGIFATKERAIQEIEKINPILLRWDEGEDTLIINDDRYNRDKVITSKGEIVTLENVASVHQYDIQHSNYNYWGIFPVEVIE
jgi:hypothetical protein